MTASPENDRLMISVSGIRGPAGTALGPREAFDYGCAFAAFLGPGSRVALGTDTRPSGSMIKNSIAAGLLACGVDVISLGVVTTPGTAVMVRHLDCDGGVVVTASHNPADQNGIKLLSAAGACLSAEDMQQVARIRQTGDFAFQGGDRIGTETAVGRANRIHVDRVLSLVDVTGISSRRFHVALDTVNGAGCTGAATLLSKLGCEVVHLNDEPDGRFGRGPEPVADNLADLCNAVRGRRADVGFALDPDGDRLAIVDETGYCPGEEYTLALCVAYTLAHRTGAIATNLSTSRMVEDIAAEKGTAVVRTPTGEANVVAALSDGRCIFGGEGNGGVIDTRISGVRDSFLGMALVLQHLFETGKTVGELVSALPAYFLAKTKIPLPDNAAGVLAAVGNAFADDTDAAIDESDGIRVALPDRWLLVRRSNTEPIIRIFAEAPDMVAAEDLLDRARAAIEKAGA